MNLKRIFLVSTFATILLVALTACEQYQDPKASSQAAKSRDATPYASYGGVGGRQYADGDQITADNVNQLKPLWSYHTGETSTGSKEIPSSASFEVTPILAQGLLYFCTPFNRVIALDPITGAELWSHNPKVDLKGYYSNQLVCRGVSYWQDPEKPQSELCAARIFTTTNDTRLLALDAKTGKLCPDFGNNGTVDIAKGAGKTRYVGEYHHTSPPAIIRDKVVIGGSISDGSGTDAPSGVVRAFNARSGELIWAQDMAPPNFDYENGLLSEEGYALATPNVWAPMIGDDELNLVFAPTGNPLPDYFREGDVNMGHYGSSLVALNGSTGEVVWNYQFVHNDFWDFDTPAQPTLFELKRNGKSIPAVAQATKMGFVFILDRRTGESLFPVEERPVPQNPDFPDLRTSPTQPFPILPEPVADNNMSAEDAFGFTFWDQGECRKEIESLRYDGMYTPPSTDWTLMYTGNAGGTNWGGLSIDQDRQVLVVNSTNLAFKVKLIPRDQVEETIKANRDQEIARQSGTSYGMWRAMVSSPLGAPCNPTPWGVLTGIDLATGKHLWQSTLGTTRDMAPVPIAFNTGTPNLGGPLMTKGGLTFIGATLDNYFRAFDNTTGKEIWRTRLPAPAVATPMSYVVTDQNGMEKQIVIIAAGGYGSMDTDVSDTLIAYALENN